MKLTITIPTYNRNDILLKNLQALLPQLTPECKVLIIDNCSEVPFEETLKELSHELEGINVEIVRNKRNIGMSGNISRCFELCETEWMWTLSDDDVVKPEAIRTIFSHIEEHPECVYFNFSVEHHKPHAQTRLTYGQQEFVDGMESFGNTIFISTGVYRSSIVSPNTRMAYHHAYSLAPQFAILLHSLGEKGLCCWSHVPIVTYRPATPGQTWSNINFALGAPTLLESPLSSDVRQSLARVLLRDAYEIAPYALIIEQLLPSAVKDPDPWNALFLHDQICFRRFYGNQRLARRLKLVLWRTLLRFPRLGRVVMKVSGKVQKGGATHGETQSRLSRL